MRRLRSILSRRELHLLLGAIFSGAFIWPLVVYDDASSVFYFMFGAWGISIVALFIMSRGAEHGDDDALGDPEGPDAGDV